jgi:hypothetical protein
MTAGKSGGRYPLARGKRGELEVAELLRPLFPEVRTRRAGGESARDTRGSDLVGTAPYVCQIKRRERLNVVEAWNEAAQNANGAVPLLIHRRDHSPWLVTMSLEEWMELEKARQLVRDFEAGPKWK